jgi:hypothetical protein
MICARQASMHLNIRGVWHDNRWNGTVCRGPSRNSFCIALDRIRTSPRDDAKEDHLAGKAWADLRPEDLPPCKTEAGAFMTPREWVCAAEHPLSTFAQDTGHARAPEADTADSASLCYLCRSLLVSAIQEHASLPVCVSKSSAIQNGIAICHL